jgi:hypothetical protein
MPSTDGISLRMTTAALALPETTTRIAMTPQSSADDPRNVILSADHSLHRPEAPARRNPAGRPRSQPPATARRLRNVILSANHSLHRPEAPARRNPAARPWGQRPATARRASVRQPLAGVGSASPHKIPSRRYGMPSTDGISLRMTTGSLRLLACPLVRPPTSRSPRS